MLNDTWYITGYNIIVVFYILFVCYIRVFYPNCTSLQVYDGPVVTRYDGYSRQRHYASSCPQPKRVAITVDSKSRSVMCAKLTVLLLVVTVDLLAKALRLVADSKTQRQQLKGFLSVQQTKRQDMSVKIKEALRDDIINTRKHQVIIVE